MVTIPAGPPHRRQSWVNLVTGPNRFRERTAGRGLEWVPDTHLRLQDALCLFGNAKIADWNGDEPNAKPSLLPPDPPWNWGDTEDFTFEYFTISDENKIIPATKEDALSWWETIEPIHRQEWEQQKSAKRRWGDCLEMARNELASGRVVSSILTDAGEIVEIPAITWRSKHGSEMLRTARAEFLVEIGAKFYPLTGSIILERSFLEVKSSSSERQRSHHSSEIDSERFPYLSFMIRVARDGPFVSSGRTSKKVLERWIRGNWPAALGIPTQTKINYIATFLRRPQDERGGIHGKGAGL